MAEVVVVGNGMAGARFVQELLARDLDRRHEITIIGDEPGNAYNRMQLSNVLAGKTRADAITLAGADWYASQGVRLVSGRTARAIDRDRRRVAIDDGSEVGYDDLVLATGSDPVLPPIHGLTIDGARNDGGLIDGAMLFRTLNDCRRIDALARVARRAVVLGAGVLGLEAARGLAGRGLQVTAVQRGTRLMERQLDRDAGHTLGRSLRALGVDVSTGSGVASLTGGSKLTGVILTDGTQLPCELLVICCGVRPRVALAVHAGLPVGDGVLVDDELRSIGDPSVRAIGECAEHDGRTYGLVAPAWEQASVAADLLAQPRCGASYRGSSVITRLKAADLELATLGEAADPGEDDDAEVVRFSDTGRGVYQKLIVRAGRLVGAILLGDTRTVGSLTQLYDRGSAVPVDRASLLMVRRNTPVAAVQTPTSLPATATICQCNGVSKAAITDAWQGGARTVEQIAARTRASTGCGTCSDLVRGLVEWLTDADPDPTPDTSGVPAVDAPVPA